MVAVSACLCGVPCRYDGSDARSDAFASLQGILPVCPEMLGGLATPRLPAEIQSGSGEDVLLGKARVLCSDAGDVTAAFIRGAEETLKLCRMHGIKRAILKANSPSCGCGYVYDGTFSGRKQAGNGVTAALLLENGIAVTSM